MKRYLVLVLVLSLLLTSCTVVDGPVNSQPEVKQPIQVNPAPSQGDNTNNDTVEDSYFGQYQMSEDGFSKYVKDNAIDSEYEEELAALQKSNEFNTQRWVELESKYIELWDKELNSTYNNLMKKLNEKEQQKLRDAQKGWLQYHSKESEFIGEAWEDLGLGTQGRVQSAMALKSRIRERTLQLMEYYFMLGGEVEFIYKGSEK